MTIWSVLKLPKSAWPSPFQVSWFITITQSENCDSNYSIRTSWIRDDYGKLGEPGLLFITLYPTLSHQIVANNTKPLLLHEMIPDKFLAPSLCKMTCVKDLWQKNFLTLEFISLYMLHHSDTNIRQTLNKTPIIFIKYSLFPIIYSIYTIFLFSISY